MRPYEGQVGTTKWMPRTEASKSRGDLPEASGGHPDQSESYEPPKCYSTKPGGPGISTVESRQANRVMFHRRGMDRVKDWLAQEANIRVEIEEEPEEETEVVQEARRMTL